MMRRPKWVLLAFVVLASVGCCHKRQCCRNDSFSARPIGLSPAPCCPPGNGPIIQSPITGNIPPAGVAIQPGF